MAFPNQNFSPWRTFNTERSYETPGAPVDFTQDPQWQLLDETRKNNDALTALNQAARLSNLRNLSQRLARAGYNPSSPSSAMAAVRLAAADPARAAELNDAMRQVSADNVTSMRNSLITPLDTYISPAQKYRDQQAQQNRVFAAQRQDKANDLEFRNKQLADQRAYEANQAGRSSAVVQAENIKTARMNTDKDFNTALQMVQRGDITDPRQIGMLFPNMDAVTYNRLAGFMNSVYGQDNSNYSTQDRLASQGNAAVNDIQEGNLDAELNRQYPAPGLFRRGYNAITGTNPNEDWNYHALTDELPDATTDQLAKLGKKLPSGYAKQITFDADTGQFIPNMVRPDYTPAPLRPVFAPRGRARVASPAPAAPRSYFGYAPSPAIPPGGYGMVIGGGSNPTPVPSYNPFGSGYDDYGY